MNLEADEFIEFATFAYGTGWRDTLSAELKVDRKSLVLLLASGEPIPHGFVNHVLEKVEDKLQRDDRSLKAIKERIARTKSTTAVKSGPARHLARAS